MARNSIGNMPKPGALTPIFLGGTEGFNTTPGGLRLYTAFLWGRPGPANPYETASDISRACLTDEDRVTLADAAYVVFSTMTPIAWKMADGRWMAPRHEYSDLSAAHTRVVVEALSHMDVRVENCNLVRP